MNETDLEAGDFARDTSDESEGDSKVVVTETLGQPAEEVVLWEEPNGRAMTVADHPSNRNEFDPESEAVRAVYADSLSRELDAWTVTGVLALTVDDDLPVREFTFPAERLEKIDPDQ